VANCIFVAARQFLWNKEIWREPGRVGFVIRTLQQIAANDETNPEARTEAEYLIKKLYEAAKKPPGAI
jgi:hypothetical protein